MINKNTQKSVLKYKDAITDREHEPGRTDILSYIFELTQKSVRFLESDDKTFDEGSRNKDQTLTLPQRREIYKRMIVESIDGYLISVQRTDALALDFKVKMLALKEYLLAKEISNV